MSTTTINGRTYTAKENPDGSITLTPLSPIAKGHNHDKLTEAQVGISEGWRTISEEERRLAKEPDKSLVEFWNEYTSGWELCDAGGRFFCTSTYRTRQPEGFFLPKPERKPEPGDVWLADTGYTHLLGKDGGIRIESKNAEQHEYKTAASINSYDTKQATYLGKHHEVYVKKSDVIAALSIEDTDGDSVMGFIKLGGGFVPHYKTRQQTRDALAKLGITAGGAE